MLLDLPDVDLAAPYEEDAFSRQPRCTIMNIVSLTQRCVFEIELEPPAQRLMVLEKAILATVPTIPLSLLSTLSIAPVSYLLFGALL